MRIPEESIREVAPQYLERDQDELYTMLIPESDRDAYSWRGRVARGKELFQNTLPRIRKELCGKYKGSESRTSNLVDLMVIIGAALLGSAEVAKLPILPLAALVAKIGLDEICREDPKQ